MEEDQIFTGVDVGSTKVCTLVGRLESQGNLRILGVGIEPSRGFEGSSGRSGGCRPYLSRKEKASGRPAWDVDALVSLAGANVTSVNSRCGWRQASHRSVLSPGQWTLRNPSQFTVAGVHVISAVSRRWTGKIHPIGMHGYRLELTLSSQLQLSIENLRQCIAAADLDVSQFVLNPWLS
jgi:cell division protein FtsA